jgi:cysteine desulfurase
MRDHQVYLDYAATTPCGPEAADCLRTHTEEYFGNPSSAHTYGKLPAQALRKAHRFFGDHFGVSPEQVIFTGSGTEANNLAIQGWALQRLAQKKIPKKILISSIEHPAVYQPAECLKDLGFEVESIPTNTQGQVTWETLKPLLSREVEFISIMRVNNIIGSIQPVEVLAERAKAQWPEIIFHCDAIQAFGKIDVPKASSKVDLVSLSGHKLGAPKGIGALLVLNKKILKEKKIRPLICGGGQENGSRSGTENVGLIAAFEAAAQKAFSHQDETLSHCQSLKETLKTALINKGLLSTGTEKKALLAWNSPENAVPYIINLSAPKFPVASLVKYLDEQGFALSSGSACSSSKTGPERTLIEIGLSPERASAAFRVSFSLETKKEEVEEFANTLEKSLIHMGKLLGIPV